MRTYKVNIAGTEYKQDACRIDIAIQRAVKKYLGEMKRIGYRLSTKMLNISAYDATYQSPPKLSYAGQIVSGTMDAVRKGRV